MPPGVCPPEPRDDGRPGGTWAMPGCKPAQTRSEDMMRDDIEIRLERGGDHAPPGSGAAAGTRAPSDSANASLGELFKQLSTDTAELVRQEATLAKAELAATASAVAHDAVKVGIATGLALAGILALTAFLIVGLGAALHNYWLSSLIVGVVILAIGGVMARGAIGDVKRRGLKPAQTLATLQADASWAREQANELKHNLTADTTAVTPNR